MSSGLKSAFAFFLAILGCVLSVIISSFIVLLEMLRAWNSCIRLGAAKRTRKITLLKNNRGFSVHKFWKLRLLNMKNTLSRSQNGNCLLLLIVCDLVYCNRSLITLSCTRLTSGKRYLRGLDIADLYCNIEPYASFQSIK